MFSLCMDENKIVHLRVQHSVERAQEECKRQAVREPIVSRLRASARPSSDVSPSGAGSAPQRG